VGNDDERRQKNTTPHYRCLCRSSCRVAVLYNLSLQAGEVFSIESHTIFLGELK
jgi:hypothetical protein